MAIFTKEVFDLENTILPYKMVNGKKLFCTNRNCGILNSNKLHQENKSKNLKIIPFYRVARPPLSTNISKALILIQRIS